MAITYDKKALKKTHKILSKGKYSYAIRSAVLYALFWFGFAVLFQFAVKSKLNNADQFGLYFYGIYGIGALCIFVFDYYSKLKSYKLLEDMYYESINYFKENDPDYLEDLDL